MFVKKIMGRNAIILNLFLFYEYIMSHQNEIGVNAIPLVVHSERKMEKVISLLAPRAGSAEWTTCAATCKEMQGGRLTTLLRSRVSTRTQSTRIYKW